MLGSKGVYTGVNIENASYGLTLCAERSALASAISQGDRAFHAIAIACIDADASRGLEEFTPCGACRQWLAELAPDAWIYLITKDAVFTLEDFLPHPFRIRPR